MTAQMIVDIEAALEGSLYHYVQELTSKILSSQKVIVNILMENP